jgi:DNA-binding response OmpR family regulator
MKLGNKEIEKLLEITPKYCKISNFLISKFLNFLIQPKALVINCMRNLFFIFSSSPLCYNTCAKLISANMRVLVVEDEKEIRDFVRRALETECFAVDAAEDGEAGLKLAKENGYDLICLDNVMPKLTGKEVCETLRREGVTTPIIMVSVRSEPNTKVELLNAGADDYLTKPFSIDELVARMRALMRRPKQMEHERYQVDDLILDAEQHLVTRGDQDVRLTRKEFALLLYLMKNRGIVLSRSMLMEHVWDMSVDPFSNTIESHIMSLRKKVDLPGLRKLIRTVSGRGYKIEAI